MKQPGPIHQSPEKALFGANWNNMAAFNPLPAVEPLPTAVPDKTPGGFMDKLRSRKAAVGLGMATAASAVVGAWAPNAGARQNLTRSNQGSNLEYQVIPTPSATNRPDDKTGQQWQAVEVDCTNADGSVNTTGVDYNGVHYTNLDQGFIQSMVKQIDDWSHRNFPDGKQFKWDTYKGQLDVPRVVLPNITTEPDGTTLKSDCADINQNTHNGGGIVNAMFLFDKYSRHQWGLDDPNKRYVFFVNTPVAGCAFGQWAPWDGSTFRFDQLTTRSVAASTGANCLLNGDQVPSLNPHSEDEAVSITAGMLYQSFAPSYNNSTNSIMHSVPAGSQWPGYKIPYNQLVLDNSDKAALAANSGLIETAPIYTPPKTMDKLNVKIVQPAGVKKPLVGKITGAGKPITAKSTSTKMKDGSHFKVTAQLTPAEINAGYKITRYTGDVDKTVPIKNKAGKVIGYSALGVLNHPSETVNVIVRK